MTLTVLNPITVFGEEELIENIDRQVNAKVSSLTAKMYTISISEIEEFCTKISNSSSDKKMSLTDFFILISEAMTIKKILFRQNQLSQMVEYQNKTTYNRLFSDK